MYCMWKTQFLPPSAREANEETRGGGGGSENVCHINGALRESFLHCARYSMCVLSRLWRSWKANAFWCDRPKTDQKVAAAGEEGRKGVRRGRERAKVKRILAQG